MAQLPNAIPKDFAKQLVDILAQQTRQPVVSRLITFSGVDTWTDPTRVSDDAATILINMRVMKGVIYTREGLLVLTTLT